MGFIIAAIIIFALIQRRRYRRMSCNQGFDRWSRKWERHMRKYEQRGNPTDPPRRGLRRIGSNWSRDFKDFEDWGRAEWKEFKSLVAPAGLEERRQGYRGRRARFPAQAARELRPRDRKFSGKASGRADAALPRLLRDSRFQGNRTRTEVQNRRGAPRLRTRTQAGLARGRLLRPPDVVRHHHRIPLSAQHVHQPVQLVVAMARLRMGFRHRRATSPRSIGWEVIRQRVFEPAIQREVRAEVTKEKEVMATEKQASLDELTASFAHEIRNPIAAAKSLVQQMGEDPDFAGKRRVREGRAR